LRVIKVACTPHRKRSGHNGRGGPEQGEFLLIATNLLDLPAEVIGLIYRKRWTVEICQPYCLQCHNFYHVTVRGFGVVNSAA